MGRYQYVVISGASAGQEDLCDNWYDNQHLADVVRVDGIVAARRFPILWSKADLTNHPQWRSLAIYEIDSDDPRAVIAAIAAAGGTDQMPISDAFSREGLTQLLIGQESGRI